MCSVLYLLMSEGWAVISCTYLLSEGEWAVISCTYLLSEGWAVISCTYLMSEGKWAVISCIYLMSEGWAVIFCTYLMSEWGMGCDLLHLSVTCTCLSLSPLFLPAHFLALCLPRFIIKLDMLNFTQPF